MKKRDPIEVAVEVFQLYNKHYCTLENRVYFNWRDKTENHLADLRAYKVAFFYMNQAWGKLQAET